MSSNVLRSTTTLFLLLCALSSSAVAFVLDTDGSYLINGGQYYIVPKGIGIGGGLSLQSKDNNSSPCPYFITRDNDETYPGIPVTISSPARITFITFSIPISIVFQDTPNICKQPLGWQVIPGQPYLTTGGTGPSFDPMETFTIEEVEEGKDNLYKIRNFEGEIDVGIFGKNGFLGINGDVPLLVMFKKAFDDVLVSY